MTKNDKNLAEKTSVIKFYSTRYNYLERHMNYEKDQLDLSKGLK